MYDNDNDTSIYTFTCIMLQFCSDCRFWKTPGINLSLNIFYFLIHQTQYLRNETVHLEYKMTIENWVKMTLLNVLKAENTPGTQNIKL